MTTLKEGEVYNKKILQGLNQWKFVHGLLKSMVKNVIVSINYLRLTPENVD